ncbi:MAG: hypothetical protein GQ525_07740 [Draconibacterium sp.]|nr:hypothetical protein [Draconibacterium sp.]
MKTRVIISLIAITFLWSCATSMKYTWTKENYQGKKYNKILVVVEAQTQQGRLSGENSIVENLAKEGITATNSLNVFPPTEMTGSLSEDEIETIILNGGYDGVLVTSLVDASTRDVLEGGGTYSQPVSYRYGRRIRTGYVHMQEPEYYRQEKSYVLETQLFDVADSANKEDVVWSGQSTLTDPSSSEAAAKTYSKTLVKTLIELGTIK